MGMGNMLLTRNAHVFVCEKETDIDIVWQEMGILLTQN